ncbi:MAG: TlpA disulfide reductase family protein [Bacteroidia bacterium]|nr:TlpA disulfide reductase family protein [Bacteroidia bacterium]
MKKVLYLLLVAAIISSCNSKPEAPHYVIKGKLIGADSITFILQKRETGKFVRLDSALVVKGEFKIEGGSVKYPDKVYLFQKNKKGGLAFYLENADITITGSIDSLANAKVTGSNTQDEFMAYQDSLKPFDKRIAKLEEEYEAIKKTGDKAKIDEFEKSNVSNFDKIDDEQKLYNKKYISNHSKSFITPSILINLSYELDAAEIEAVISTMDTTVTKVTVIKDLQARVAVMKTVAIGQKAPDFTQNDVNDKPTSLSSKIGKSKLLLIDFWASWCGPCRAENPNVVKVYNEFKNKGFDVFGVSLDRKKEDWLKAIENDRLTWTHVSDLKFWNNEAAKLYAVNSIPANFLLDEKGIIIGRNLRGEALANKVKEVLGGK